ncbi:TIGR03759 family integrating conjugative element protein [Pseudomonas moraviensis]
MSYSRLLPVLLLPVCLIASASQPNRQFAVETRSTLQADQLSGYQRKQLAKQWGLDEEEWDRYRALMQGPLGIYSPNLDPLSALGIEARNDTERQRYALLQVDAEAARVEKLLVYQRAYDQAWADRHPNMKLVSFPALSSPVTAPHAARKAVFVRFNCPECVAKVRQLQGAGTKFDLYVVDSQQDEKRVRQWAQNAGITADKIRNGSITINHDNGRWESTQDKGDFPAVMHKVNGVWMRQ